MIASDSIEAGAMEELKGLVDVVLTEGDPATTTTANVIAELCFGTFGNLQRQPGLTPADFSADGGVTPATIYNESTASNVSVTSVDENEDGDYILNFGAQVVGNVLRIQIVKNGLANEPITVTI
jgi:hypothetical protein